MSKIEELKKKLYEENSNLEEKKKPFFLPKEYRELPAKWQDEEEKSGGRYLNYLGIKKTWLLPAFFAIAVLGSLFAYLLMRGGGIGVISSKNIDLEIEAPENIKGGEKVSWIVVINNKNSISLEEVDLIVEWPERSRPAIGSDSKEKLRTRKTIGEIKPGEVIQEKFDAFIFGSEGSERILNVFLEYRLKDSSAIFEKSKSHTFKIIQTPVAVSFKDLGEIVIGKEFQTKINIVSNSESVIKNLVLDVEYPDNFSYKSASLLPEKGNINRWIIGDLNPKETKEIAIRGSVLGGVSEANFKALVGVLNEEGNLDVFDENSLLSSAKKSFLDVKLSINGKEDYTAKKGEKLKIELTWSNNLPVAIRNAVLELNMSGEVFDLKTLSIERGFYKESDRAVVWDSSTNKGFALVEPGEEGGLSVGVEIIDPLPIKSFSDKNFEAVFKARFFSNDVPEQYKDVDIEGREEKIVKISSEIQFVQSGLYYSGPFKNTGPIPPKIGQETTYAVTWSVVNSSNNTSNVEVSAFLPNHVRFLNAVDPSSKSKNISYNEETREIVWKIDELEANTGVMSPAEKISFQIAFTPTADQESSSPILVSKTSAEGKDDFTGVVVRSTSPALTTDLRGDPQMDRKGGKVVK